MLRTIIYFLLHNMYLSSCRCTTFWKLYNKCSNFQLCILGRIQLQAFCTYSSFTKNIFQHISNIRGQNNVCNYYLFAYYQNGQKIQIHFFIAVSHDNHNK